MPWTGGWGCSVGAERVWVKSFRAWTLLGEGLASLGSRALFAHRKSLLCALLLWGLVETSDLAVAFEGPRFR